MRRQNPTVNESLPQHSPKSYRSRLLLSGAAIMQFLKSVGSYLKSPGEFPFDLDQGLKLEDSLWHLHKATQQVSVNCTQECWRFLPSNFALRVLEPSSAPFHLTQRSLERIPKTPWRQEMGLKDLKPFVTRTFLSALRLSRCSSVSCPDIEQK